MIIKKISLVKYIFPAGLAVLSHELLMAAAKFSKVCSMGMLELIVPVGVFAGYFAIINKFKNSTKDTRALPSPPDYDKDYEYLNNQPDYNEQSGWNCDKEFITRERGVKEETFINGVKRTVYEFERRSNTW